MIIRNEDIKELTAEIPEGHKHLRTTIIFRDGTEFVFQEATIKGKRLTEGKDDYAERQLVEDK